MTEREVILELEAEREALRIRAVQGEVNAREWRQHNDRLVIELDNERKARGKAEAEVQRLMLLPPSVRPAVDPSRAPALPSFPAMPPGASSSQVLSLGETRDPNKWAIIWEPGKMTIRCGIETLPIGMMYFFQRIKPLVQCIEAESFTGDE